MSSRVYPKLTTTSIPPADSKLGDRYYDPVANQLYELVPVNGTSVGWVQIPLVLTGNLYSGNIVLAAANSITFGDGTIQTTAGSTGGGGATVTNETANTSTYYPLFTTITSGSLTTANVNNAGLTFVPGTGTLSATIFQSLSDENEKTNIRIINNAMEITENLRGVTFDWKNNGLPSAGLIAQDVEKYLPQLINTNKETKSLNYNGIIGVLVESIKELNQRVKDLESKQ